MPEMSQEIGQSIIHAPKAEHTAVPPKEKPVLREIQREVVILPRVTAEKHTLEAARAKKLQKKPLPSLWKDKAEFLPETTSFFRNCGIDPDYVNPIPMGQGFTHVVFSYQPEGSEPKVIKIPRASTNSFMSTGYHDDLENISLVKKYFGEYAVPTELRLDTKTGKYLYVQNEVKGKPVNHLTETQSVRSQLTDMARLNREMMRQTGQSLDFLGVPGFFSLMRHHIRHIFTAASEFEISNVLVDESGKLKIIDDGLLRLRNVPFVQRMVSEFGFMANRLIMKLYFGVSLKPKI
jgi:hypothetical protein